MEGCKNVLTKFSSLPIFVSSRWYEKRANCNFSSILKDCRKTIFVYWTCKNMRNSHANFIVVCCKRWKELQLSFFPLKKNLRMKKFAERKDHSSLSEVSRRFHVSLLPGGSSHKITRGKHFQAYLQREGRDALLRRSHFLTRD